MFIGQTLPFVKSFVDELDLAVRVIDPAAGLSRIQKEWLGFCLLAIFVTNSVSGNALNERVSASIRPGVCPGCFVRPIAGGPCCSGQASE
jgi:hypothetical protein